MARETDFHQLVERLIECDEPLKEGELEKFRNDLSRQLATSQKGMRNAFMAIVVCAPLLILSQILTRGVSSVPQKYPDWVFYPATVLSAATLGIIGLAAIWLILFFIPRYLRARSNFRDSMLMLLARRVDELSQRIESRDKKE